MNLLSLTYYTEAARELNLSKAAHNLHTSQQTLSFHIQRLEEHYGVALFNRKPRLSLTYAGEILYQRAQDLLEKNNEITDAMAAISEKCIGKLRLGLSSYLSSVLLPIVLPSFHAKWPNIRILIPKLNMSDRLTALEEAHLDICIGIYDENPSCYNSQFLYEDRLCLVVSDDLLKKHFATNDLSDIKAKYLNGVELEDFSSFPFMQLSLASHLGKVVDGIISKVQFSPSIILEANALYALEPLADKGIGIFICGRMRAERLIEANPGLNAFPLKSTDASPDDHCFRLLTRRNHELPEYVQDFIQLTREAFYNMNSNSIMH